MEYKKDIGSRARSNHIYQSNIRPAISYFENPATDLFYFSFPLESRETQCTEQIFNHQSD